jgi:hypothetical protein
MHTYDIEVLKDEILEKVRDEKDVRQFSAKLQADASVDAGYVPLALDHVINPDGSALRAIGSEETRSAAEQFASQIREKIDRLRREVEIDSAGDRVDRKLP